MSLEYGEFDPTKVNGATIAEVFEDAIVSYIALLRKIGRTPLDKAFGINHNDAYHYRRCRVVAFAGHSFPTMPDAKIHPKGVLFASGAIIAYNALRLNWTRRREAFKNPMLDFVLDDALRPDNWSHPDTSETTLMAGINTRYSYSPIVVSALSIPNEDRDEGEGRAIGAGWVCSIAEQVERLEVKSNASSIARQSIQEALQKLCS